jgi:RNA polymerase sigma factor (sigma-70 family)
MTLSSSVDRRSVAVYPDSPSPVTGNLLASPQRGGSLRALRGLDDEELTELVVSGSESAFAVIYDRYMPALLRYCRRIVGADDAEDAAQSAMVRAMSAIGKRPPRRLRPWLYRIAHNEAVGLVRTRRGSFAQLDPEQADAAADPAQAAATRSRLGQLLVDLHALPGRQRNALVLREICGRSYAEIAAELGTSEGAAQQAVFAARSALHALGDGRDLTCAEVQRSISDCERGRLRSRRIRAHLRACERCSSFERELYARRRDFALLLPWIGATSLPQILGLAGGTHMLVRIARAPLPPDGLRAAAAVTAAAALSVAGLTINALSSPSQGGIGSGKPAAVRFSSNQSPARASTSVVAIGAPTTSAASGHGSARQGGLSAHAGSRSGNAGQAGMTLDSAASEVGSSGSGPSSSGSASGGGGGGSHGSRLPGQSIGISESLGAAKQVTEGAGSAVNNAAGTVQSTVSAVGDTASQTVSDAGATVNSATQAVGSAVQHLTGALH